MKAEYINSFYNATRDVLKLMVNWDIERGEVSAKDGLIGDYDANIVLGITGDLTGYAVFKFPNDLVFSMVSSMSGMRVDEFNGFVKSALGEVANIISGGAMTELTSCGYTCDILPPKMIVKDSEEKLKTEEKTLELEMVTEVGNFTINIHLEDN